jgi:hypothetical protein
MTSTTTLIDKYTHYKAAGHGVFAVTLSTYVKSDRLAASDEMRLFWDFHLIYRVKRCLPFKAKLDHDWTVEESPDGYYHYHGFVAIQCGHTHRIWTVEKGLSVKLRRALDSFATKGKYRHFRVNKYLIEPVDKVEAWATYSTKQCEVRT